MNQNKLKMTNLLKSRQVGILLSLASSVIVLASLFVSCHKSPILESFTVDIERFDVGVNSVSIAGSYEFKGTGEVIGMAAAISRNEDFSDARIIGMDLQGNHFDVTADDLEKGTLFHYRFIVDYGGEKEYLTAADTFTTLEFGVPVLTTAEVSYIGAHEAVCGGNVTDDGGAEVTARGVCYGPYPEPDLNGLHTVDSCGLGVFVSELFDLQMSTRYYVRAYATNGNGTAYGEQREFTTSAQPPVVVTLEVNAVGMEGVNVKAEVLADGGNIVTQRGVCWSKEDMPTLDDDFIGEGSGTGVYTCSILRLESNTTYYFRAFARNDVGLGFGDVLSFTTGTPVVLPTVITVEISDVTAVSAKCVCNVSANGGAEITDRGVCWGVGPTPTLSNNHASGGTGTGIFTVELGGLASNTLYYARAYATNSLGTAYGEAISFTTTEGLPVVTTATVGNITATAATGGGEVTDQGASQVTERGVCWSTEYGPTIEGSHAGSGFGLGSFTAQMSGLIPEQTYFVRAYAINAQGVAYGNEVGFVAVDGLAQVTSSSISNITSISARGNGYVGNQGSSMVTDRGFCWSTAHAPTLSDSHATAGSGPGSFSCELTGLAVGTQYYARAYAVNGQGVTYGEELSFTTLTVKPEVTTLLVTNITQTTATGNGEVTSSGGSIVTERGICWSTSHNPTMGGSHVSGGSGIGGFIAQMTGLQAGTTYYVRAYAINEQGIAYGGEVSFTTTSSSPTVTTAQVSNIGQTTALGGGNVTNDGGATVTERGICWGINHNPTMGGLHATNGTGTGAFTVEMTGLASNTTYFVRAYAINSAGISYGAEVSFTTSQSQSAPSVVTAQATNITQTTATGGGTVTADGGSPVTERGICWSISHNPTVNGSHASNGSGMGSYTVQMTGLAAHTTYYVRAYAINSIGTSYGNEMSFSTLAEIPTVTTTEVSNITQTTALGGGNVTDDGGAAVSARGICWGTSHNPTVADSHASSGTGIGGFTVNMVDLTPNTTYYVRAYAINNAGTAYGNEVSFTTAQGVAAPTVTTLQVTDITQTAATGGGEVTSDGGATVVGRGICWGTEHNPTISDSHGSNGTGTGTFTVDLSDLSPSTTYYVRAYAINSVGTSYGNEVSFTTTDYLFAPTVITSEVSNITQTSALGGGNVTNDGGAAVTERGICWSTSPNPTTSNSHGSSGTGTGGFTVSMTGLTANTTYFVRAYAINNQGTSYGEEVSFATAQNIAAPTVTTLGVTGITQSTATGGGNVTADGGADVTERGICWSTAQNPSVSGNHIASGTGTGIYTIEMTGLAANTMYYVRAYAVNSAGTSYGNEVSFTTTANLPMVTTFAVTDIGQTTAMGGGNVATDGGATVTDRGICWSVVPAPTVNGSHVSSGSGTGNFTASMASLIPNTTYYVRAYAMNSAGTSYGNEVSFVTLPSGGGNAPTGAIDGLFSVSASEQVYFSQGNLQYQASTNTWRFAPNQYDLVGLANNNISEGYTGWIDLFGWGTSGYNHGAVCYQPWSTSVSESSYNAYGNQDYNLYDQSGQADWGFNAISNGGNQTNHWRTLTIEEWTYVLNTRSTASGIRYAKAIVNGVNGLIVLPDDWNATTYALANTNVSSAYYLSNMVSAAEWNNVMEPAGAVFLPAAGSRYATTISAYSGDYAKGFYWASTHDENYGAMILNFTRGALLVSLSQYRYMGLSVRVVYPAQ